MIKFEIHDTAQNFEKILDYIFIFSSVLTRFRVNHKVASVLSEERAKLHSVVIDCLVVKEVHLLKDVNDVHLVINLQIVFHNLAVFSVESFDRINFFFVYWVGLLWLGFWGVELSSISL